MEEGVNSMETGSQDVRTQTGTRCPEGSAEEIRVRDGDHGVLPESNSYNANDEQGQGQPRDDTRVEETRPRPTLGKPEDERDKSKGDRRKRSRAAGRSKPTACDRLTGLFVSLCPRCRTFTRHGSVARRKRQIPPWQSFDPGSDLESG